MQLTQREREALEHVHAVEHPMYWRLGRVATYRGFVEVFPPDGAEFWQHLRRAGWVFVNAATRVRLTREGKQALGV